MSEDVAGSRKTNVTIRLDSDLWKKFQVHLISKYGKSRQGSRIIEELIADYLQKQDAIEY